MKKIITLFLVASTLAITIISCSKDDDSPSSESAIAGKWYFDSTLTAYNGQENPQEVPYNYSQCNGKKSYYDFRPGGVLDEGAVFSDCTLHYYTDSWVLNGEVLHIVLDTGEPQNYDLVSVTSTKLILKRYLTSDKKSYTVYNFTRQ